MQAEQVRLPRAQTAPQPRLGGAAGTPSRGRPLGARPRSRLPGQALPAPPACCSGRRGCAVKGGVAERSGPLRVEERSRRQGLRPW